MAKVPTPPTEQAAAEQSLQDLKTYAQWIVLVVAIVMVGIAGTQWWRSRRASQEMEQFLALSQAFTPEGLEEVVAAFPGTSAAQLALLQQASMLQRQSEFTKALSLYDQFLAENRQHPLRAGAQFNRSLTLEALGRMDEAFAGFSATAETDLFFPQALFGQARILEQRGEVDAAVAVYEKIEAQFAEQIWAFQAEEFRKAAKLTGRVPEAAAEVAEADDAAEVDGDALPDLAD